MNYAIYDYLKGVARAGDITTYSDTGRIDGLEMSTDVGRIRIAQILDEINQYEHDEGRPMISALVTLKETGIPGQGFFNCAIGLGRHDGRDDEAFWVQEVKRVYQYWKNP